VTLPCVCRPQQGAEAPNEGTLQNRVDELFFSSNSVSRETTIERLTSLLWERASLDDEAVAAFLLGNVAQRQNELDCVPAKIPDATLRLMVRLVLHDTTGHVARCSLLRYLAHLQGLHPCWETIVTESIDLAVLLSVMLSLPLVGPGLCFLGNWIRADRRVVDGPLHGRGPAHRRAPGKGETQTPALPIDLTLLAAPRKSC
jgi:hypothetical protein